MFRSKCLTFPSLCHLLVLFALDHLLFLFLYSSLEDDLAFLLCSASCVLSSPELQVFSFFLQLVADGTSLDLHLSPGCFDSLVRSEVVWVFADWADLVQVGPFKGCFPLFCFLALVLEDASLSSSEVAPFVELEVDELLCL